MKNELKVQQCRSRKYRCPVWPVCLFGWGFPLDNFRRRVVNAARKMEGFVGFCDPKIYIREDDRGVIFFVLFDTKAHAIAGRDLISEKFPQQSVGPNCIMHYAAREPYDDPELMRISLRGE